ncbi:cytochrome P450 [Donghicola sp. C2-DW-16]|uniref:Cytochrome P450 n=2 Tax=Donghicola mangrovi TaxID=2729614 RepID=A0ABX2PBN1_9RHOB|nr:cytochrome P450 [Donghicola mangrovi]
MGVWKSLQTMRRNVLETLPEISTRQPMVSGRTGKRWHMVMDPDALNHMLRDRLPDYPKSDVTKDILRPAIGESLFIAEGQEWHWQRRTAAPSFSLRNVTALAPVMSAAAERCVQRLDAVGGLRAVNMYDEMVQTTFEVISDVTFSGQEGFDRDVVHAALEAYIQSTAKMSLGDLLGLPSWVPRLNRLRNGDALKTMQRVADGAIQARRQSGTKGVPDLLDLLLAGEDPESGRRMTTEELRDNLLTFIVAGHETTALSLSWALYLVANDPRVQDIACAEARAVLGDRVATAEDIPHLPYIRQIVDEALRLYPPAALVSRTALKDDRLCGREVKAGDTVMIPIYALHRNYLLWDEPDSFRPERFADRKAIRRYAYLPFGDGPRICIGASFALTEAVIILASILTKYRFDPVAGKVPKPVMILTLRPDGGVWLMPKASKPHQL